MFNNPQPTIHYRVFVETVTGDDFGFDFDCTEAQAFESLRVLVACGVVKKDEKDGSFFAIPTSSIRRVRAFPTVREEVREGEDEAFRQMIERLYGPNLPTL